ncbi:helix-turn-helix domain-containing protein [Paenibacillus contaminans]|nr:helix-turn-helix domain-containing protein [Paenibacillus contaminans]
MYKTMENPGILLYEEKRTTLSSRKRGLIMLNFASILKRATFKHKLALFSLFVSITPVLIVGLSSAYLSMRSMQEEVNGNHAAALKQIHYQINNIIKSLHITSIGLASNPAVEKSVQAGPGLDSLNQTFEMIEAVRRENSFSTLKFDMSLAYVKYDSVYSTADSSKMTQSRFTEMVRSNKPLYNSSFMVMDDSDKNEPALLLFRPVPMYTYYTDGILVLHVSIDEFVKFFDTLTTDNKSRIFIVDKSGKVIVGKNKGDIGTRLANIPLDKEKDTQLKLPDSYSLDGVDYSMSFQNSSFNDWTYIVMTPMQLLTQRTDEIKQITLVVVAVIIVVWSLFSLFGSYRLYYPIALLLRKFMPADSDRGQFSDGLKALDSLIDSMVVSNRELKREIDEQSTYLEQYFFQQLILGEASDQEMRRKTERYGLPLQGSRFLVCIASVDDYPQFIRKYKEQDRTLVHYAMRKMILELLGDRPSCLAGVMQPGQVTVIVPLEAGDDEAENRVLQAADDFRRYGEQYFHFTASIAVSDARRGYASINDSYEQATELLRHRLTLGHNVTITESSVGPAAKQLSQFITERQKTIVFHVIHGNIEEANLQLSDMLKNVPLYTKSADGVVGSLSYLLGELEYMLYKMGCPLHEALEGDVYRQLYGMSTIREVEQWLKQVVFPTVKAQLERFSVKKQTKIIQHVLQYVDEHYKTDLSLQHLADAFDLSPSHLSRMFKEETNRAFSDYLLEYRMNKAKEWLAHTSMPIKEIADHLRYTNVTNFSRAFKQFFGTSPGKYRSHSLSE